MAKILPDEVNKDLCSGCSDCCEYVALEIDRPTCNKDYDNIYWYLLHENIVVFADEDNDWYIEFKTKCKNLKKNQLCGDYQNRPNICREYSPKECTRWGDDPEDKYRFENAKQFLDWLKTKGKKYKFKEPPMAKRTKIRKKKTAIPISIN